MHVRDLIHLGTDSLELLVKILQGSKVRISVNFERAQHVRLAICQCTRQRRDFLNFAPRFSTEDFNSLRV